ncbi:MAG: cysteine--tRNA ligase [Rhizobiales bacterium]|nr:cysteine--tRNA ligase [Hyphomicrobiales bacterium]
MSRALELQLYNTLTRRKERFEPIDAGNVRMYVCGPTVYDYAHIGNARPIIVFDLLFRLLRHVYGAEHVTYARNITDVEDKINDRARDEGTTIFELTARTAAQFHADIAHLGVLEPTVEPRATGHIEEMKALIEDLIARGHAYVAEDHVLFHVPSMASYGRLSNRSLEEMEAGARVEVAPYKRDAMDFVLWKPSEAHEPSWPSPAGIARPGRPGWHIECSAMAGRHLGKVFDIHGGGIDLVFPHHENEIAQSCGAHGTDTMARVWMHNGFLQVEGEKMSKSLGNFVTVHEMVEGESFGGTRWHGLALRLAMLQTHYRQPLDWTVERLSQARATLADFADICASAPADGTPNAEVLAALADDLNTPSAISILHGIAKSARRGNAERAAELRATLVFMGLYGGQTRDDIRLAPPASAVDAEKIEALIAARTAARKARDFAAADRIRDELAAMGIAIKDGPAGTTWEVAS